MITAAGVQPSTTFFAAGLALALAALGCGSEVAVIGTWPAPSYVGEPCVLMEEHNPAFGGSSITERTTELRGDLDVCLAIGFQGRVTCPRGQAPRVSCGSSAECADGQCTGGVCYDLDDPDTCTTPSGAAVSERVCGQCANRSAPRSVFRSCRCGLDQGQPDDGAPLCACPDDMICELVNPYFGTSTETAGRYCVWSDTMGSTDTSSCGVVDGFWNPTCAGTPSS